MLYIYVTQTDHFTLIYANYLPESDYANLDTLKPNTFLRAQNPINHNLQSKWSVQNPNIRFWCDSEHFLNPQNVCCSMRYAEPNPI